MKLRVADTFQFSVQCMTDTDSPLVECTVACIQCSQQLVCHLSHDTLAHLRCCPKASCLPLPREAVHTSLGRGIVLLQALLSTQLKVQQTLLWLAKETQCIVQTVA